MAKNDIDEKIKEALTNIRGDRNAAKSLLQPILLMVEQDPKNVHLQREVGQVANKYIENIQKSNEQLIKIIGLMQKNKEDDTFTGFTNEESTNLFEFFEEADRAKEEAQEDG